MRPGHPAALQAHAQALLRVTIGRADPSREVEAETPGIDTASVLIFTARPGSIVTAGSTEVCYAVSDAVLARIEPAVGNVPPTSTLTCRRVAPSHTTTYVLTAPGRDGVVVTKQLVIVVS
jgi:hypothetical protein